MGSVQWPQLEVQSEGISVTGQQLGGRRGAGERVAAATRWTARSGGSLAGSVQGRRLEGRHDVTAACTEGCLTGSVLWPRLEGQREVAAARSGGGSKGLVKRRQLEGQREAALA